MKEEEEYNEEILQNLKKSRDKERDAQKKSRFKILKPTVNVIENVIDLMKAVEKLQTTLSNEYDKIVELRGRKDYFFCTLVCTDWSTSHVMPDEDAWNEIVDCIHLLTTQEKEILKSIKEGRKFVEVFGHLNTVNVYQEEISKDLQENFEDKDKEFLTIVQKMQDSKNPLEEIFFIPESFDCESISLKKKVDICMKISDIVTLFGLFKSNSKISQLLTEESDTDKQMENIFNDIQTNPDKMILEIVMLMEGFQCILSRPEEYMNTHDVGLSLCGLVRNKDLKKRLILSLSDQRLWPDVQGHQYHDTLIMDGIQEVDLFQPLCEKLRKCWSIDTRVPISISLEAKTWAVERYIIDVD